jgi:hypothetical protein
MRRQSCCNIFFPLSGVETRSFRHLSTTDISTSLRITITVSLFDFGFPMLPYLLIFTRDCFARQGHFGKVGLLKPHYSPVGGLDYSSAGLQVKWMQNIYVHRKCRLERTRSLT